MLYRPLFRTLDRPLTAQLQQPLSGFTPLSLFANGEQGAWYDPSDLNTLFQDAAGTIPVTASGDPVGLMRDKSGRGNHASQATAGSRPTFRDVGGLRYLEFDGVDDFLVTANINFTATDKMNVFAAPRTLTSTRGALLTNGAGGITPGTDGRFALEAPGSVANSYVATLSKTTANGDAVSAAITPPSTDVLAALYDGAATLSVDVVKLRKNTIQTTTSAADTPNAQLFLNAPLYIGRRGGTDLPFNGHLYGLVVRGALTNAAGISSMEQYLASKSGIVLP